MVVIRLSRGGAKKSPFYHIVAADKRRARDARYLERLGYFNPLSAGNETRLELNQERIDYWIKQGAQPSDTVKMLIQEYANPEMFAKKEKAKADKKAAKVATAKAKAEAEAKAAADEAKAAEEAAAKEAAAAAEAKAAEEKPAEDKPAEEAKADDSDKA